MPGKLIVLEGTDASGKSTQFKLLCERLRAEGCDFRTVAFPRYTEDSSVLLRMYLNGDFGKKPGDVNAYTASVFFAVDRCASYLGDWREYYQNGGTLLLDRYTTSNAVHQGAKMTADAREAFFKWLFDFEYNLLGLPAPDHVFLLDMPIACAAELLAKREGKTIDIHEHDLGYLESCHTAACHAAELFSWQSIKCTENNHIRSIEDIHSELYSRVREVL